MFLFGHQSTRATGSRDAKAGPLETLTVAESAEPDHDRKSLDRSPRASISGPR